MRPKTAGQRSTSPGWLEPESHELSQNTEASRVVPGGGFRSGLMRKRGSGVCLRVAEFRLVSQFENFLHALAREIGEVIIVIIIIDVTAVTLKRRKKKIPNAATATVATVCRRSRKDKKEKDDR